MQTGGGLQGEESRICMKPHLSEGSAVISGSPKF